MNPLPRFLALGVFVVLAALSVMLAGPALRRASPAPAGAVAFTPAPAHIRVAQLSQRLAFPLALAGTAVALALAVSLSLRPARAAVETAGIVADQAGMKALARLAESSVAQGQELAHERDERLRAEADALLHHRMLNRSLEEKIQLGRDLHDGIIQSLYAAGLTIESARAVVSADPAEADRQLARCREHLNQTIRDIRSYISGLAPENLRSSGFTDALHALVRELGGGRDTGFELRIDDDATAQLSPEQSTETLQIAREAISNSLRHGGASQLQVRLHAGEGAVSLLVQDNGHGFDPAHASAGHGLANMRARAERSGGTLRVESSDGGGTRVVFTLPVKA